MMIDRKVCVGVCVVKLKDLKNVNDRVLLGAHLVVAPEPSVPAFGTPRAAVTALEDAHGVGSAVSFCAFGAASGAPVGAPVGGRLLAAPLRHDAATPGKT